MFRRILHQRKTNRVTNYINKGSIAYRKKSYIMAKYNNNKWPHQNRLKRKINQEQGVAIRLQNKLAIGKEFHQPS